MREDLVLDAVGKKPCLVCERRPVDVAHIKTRGSGPVNRPFNLMPLCRFHHVVQHQVGIMTFVKQFKEVAIYLQVRGWKVSPYGKLIHPKLCAEDVSNWKDLSEFC